MQGLKLNSMRRILIIIGCVVLLAGSLHAQRHELKVEGGGTGSLYLTHTVAAKEGLYAIGRMYGITPKDLAAYNGLQSNQGLSVGQTIKIPLNSSNFSQDIKASSKTGAVPVYHVVKEKEGMYRVSVNHLKVPYDAIKKWNNMSGDVLATGQKLIVGYLTSAGDNLAAVTPPQKPVVEEKKPEVVKPVVVQPEEKKEIGAVKKEEPKIEPKKEEPKVEAKQPVYLPKGSSYFQSAFEGELRNGRSVKTTTLNGAIFKSTSGWQDGKFYILMNQVEPGTLVKITNIGNNKTIFAKVLGEVPDLRQNSGLSFRLSNAAAAELAVADENRFNVEVSF